MFWFGALTAEPCMATRTKRSLLCLPASLTYCCTEGNVLFLEDIIEFVCRTECCESEKTQPLEFLLWVFRCFAVLFTATDHVSVGACAFSRTTSERMPGRKRQRVCGILLSRHKRDMRSPRAFVIMRECIVAVFKTAAVDG